MFPYEFYEFFKNSYFYRTALVDSSESISTYFMPLVSLYIPPVNMKKNSGLLAFSVGGVERN